MPTVTRLTSDEEWDAAVPILRQLWSHESESFVRGWREEEDYELYGYYAEAGPSSAREAAVETDEPDANQDLVGVVGLSVQRVLHHRRHAWIHDLVVDEDHRGRGHGAALLGWVEDWARERDCEYVALANVLDNDEGISFYEDNGFERWGYVVETEL